MAHVGAAYYAGLLTAVGFYGVDAVVPETFQVVTDKNRPPVQCGRVAVTFIARGSAAEVPTREFATNRGRIKVSSPEATAIDLAAYPQHAAGLDNVGLVLLGLAHQIDGAELARLAPLIAETPWVQRLGYLLDQVGATDVTGPLAEYVATAAAHATPLDPRLPWTGVSRDPRWKVALNSRSS